MPRAIWSGSISFGLVNIPVKLYSAVSRKTVHFNQLDSRTGARVKQRRVDAETGEEVPWDQIVKGYELDSGAYVTISEDELAALDPKAVRTIDLEEFVDLSSIDPIFYDAAYYLVPDKSSKPYALLARAMEEEGKVGIAHFVMRTKQYLAAIRPQEGRLVLSTMVYADEINDPAEIPDLAEVAEVEVSDKELAMATQLVESLSADFEPARFQDTYRQAVLDLIDRKAAGEEVVVPAATAEPERVVDLMAALEASVAAAKETRKRHPTARGADTGDADDEGQADEAGEARSKAS
ncbi:Ku protein [Rhabdothermincola salaria]|uniref:non-homologous end joining protein Ku n=1 Tax=Rhabdothermincola salaria TaxID=2903142 RepID=UPI001E2A7460|nr:Ku protein [Rhabdothermincola salaria]MCD9623401.1 Ku protein [Rhabdothermincola salaria]